ncbi:MAG: glutathione S-transferase family protein [Hyphomicrobiaceae bacterium]
MHLTIANKLYSSWSLRPWILMKAKGIAFDETIIPLDQPDTSRRIRAISAAGRVPILQDGSCKIWESLAILEHLNDRFPDKEIWPSKPAARAHARSIASEMHAGFTALRSACPMNLGKKFAPRNRGADVAADVARVDTIWCEARDRFGAEPEGPFLYGAFSAADAMYAPVVTRLDTYSFDMTTAARSYMDAVLGHSAYREWLDAALQETWIVPSDEVDEEPIETYRPQPS